MLCRGPGLCSSLSSWRAMGAHDDQYPHIFYPLYEKLLYKLGPGVQQGGSGAPVPEGDVRQRWHVGQASQGDDDSRRIFNQQAK